MKKIAVWPIAVLTSAASLIAMCIFDFILSLIYYFIEKIPFLSDIIEYIGEILDLGLTALVAALIATFIWKFGHTIIEKISGRSIAFKYSPVSYVNCVFILVFLAALIFLGYTFATLIGSVVTSYTADLQGMDKFLMFFKAVKDTFVFVRGENIILYALGYNSLVLSVINIFSDTFID